MSGRVHGVPAGLFWRVYLHGVLLLLLVALAVVAVALLLGHAPPGRSPERFAAYAAARVAELRSDPPRLARELARVREAFGAQVTVYDGEAVLASNVAPPLPPPAAAERARLAAGPVRLAGRRWAFAAAVEGAPGAYLVLAGGIPSPSLLRFATFLAAILAALAVGSIPLARRIAAPLERLGRAVRAFGAGDLSARARLGAPGEAGEVAAAFDQMADRIEALVRGEKELLANVSHELRTPLARIRVALELAAEGDADRARRYLAEIGADLQELDRLVEDVLTAARLDLARGRGEATALPMRAGPVDPGELLAGAAERFRAAHPERALTLDLPGALPTVTGDARLLRRVLDNLLDNAWKYAGPEAPVALAARAEGEDLVVEVEDRGIGLDPEELARLFTPFFRSDRARARAPGVGLGLALARRIVEAHGGRIEAESAPGQGTRVRFRVPGQPRGSSGAEAGAER